MFTDITMLTYIRSVNCNVQIINGRKTLAKGFSLVIIIIPTNKIIIPICPSYYMQQNPQNTISQTTLKYYNQFISERNETIRWLKIAIDTGKKLKVETTVIEIDQKLLYFITIDVLNIEH